ncbi:hypothetical protein [Pseudonocardia sp. ICBG601]|uniref:hypothetical protein n=1 Tax=Pseudonocardia sp. ICBG601 TaxID=2846759 RepID=UPI001CF6A490|nr:hypothetical protein [Pseudonocardia sp. ICBG601]
MPPTTPRGEKPERRPERPPSDGQPGRQPPTWTPRPRRDIAGGRHAAPEPEYLPHQAPIDPADAASLAWAFALDLESFDEDHPHRRDTVLARYLPHTDTRHLGWDRTGRQRAETATTGTVTHHDDTHLTVDVRVRITPYTRTPHPARGPRAPSATPDPPSTPDAVPAAAPAPTASGWTPGASEWKRLRIPITRTTTGDLTIDLTPTSHRNSA